MAITGLDRFICVLEKVGLVLMFKQRSGVVCEALLPGPSVKSILEFGVFIQCRYILISPLEDYILFIDFLRVYDTYIKERRPNEFTMAVSCG